MNFTLLRIFDFTAIGLVVVAVLVPSLVYRGKLGERYSLFNHFISELGEVGVSRLAWVFNTCLTLSGLLLLPYIVGLGLKFHSVLGWLGMAFGIVAAVGVAAVGLLPMNDIKTHATAAITYFRAGLVMVFFFGLAILFQPSGEQIVPQAANLLSLLAFLAYGSFLSLPVLTRKQGGKRASEMLDPGQTPVRPPFWPLACLEWLVFFSTIAWLFGMGFFI